ncbi:MAG TPA: polyprenyl synthetase family protein [Pontiellaceae bacterium]|nr:polyprenyl synthetase family protein [Pontiellaceae bacterium]HPR83186.1 polyprenyl synthetase family protein [Pontiellaceae bacterium]
MNDLQNHLKRQSEAVNAALDALLPPETERPLKLHNAMRYSIFAGGKRLRPALCIAACEACGGTAEQAMPAACALELLHTYTLIHDDLPAMDDDTLRRGRPTCHIAFDEATAILAGDALLTLAFEVLAGQPQGGALALELARAAGSRGVIGGQAEDIDAEGKAPDAALVEYIHRNKTAALIRAACVMGGMCAGADLQTLKHLAIYGENTGLAFQLADDLLDESATVEELGKDIGSDKERGKMTWPAVHGTEKTAADAKQLTADAVKALQGLKNPARLGQLAEFIAGRTY